MKRAIFWSAMALAIGCAPSPRLPAPAEPARPHKARPSVNVDAVLPSGRNLFVFDFAQSRYQKWDLGALDTLRGDWSAPSHWLALPAPGRPFAPLRAVWGPSGNFFLLDRAGKRLSQHDSGAQLLSSFPLPPEIRDRNLDRFEVFWTRDGLFSFLDLGDGTVWQYAEMRTSGSQGDWRLRNTLRLPLGLETCAWEPFFRDLCCLRGGTGAKAGTEGRSLCFDKYFNERTAPPDASPRTGLRLEPVSGAPEWLMILDRGSDPPACFSPEKGFLPTCPAETDPAPPR